MNRAITILLLFLFTLVAMLIAAPFVRAEQTLNINKFGGLNTDDPPLLFKNGETPDSQNVVTDLFSGSLTGRLGYVLTSTNPATAVWPFSLSNGTNYRIIHSTNNLLADTGSGNFATLVSTVATGVTTTAASLGDKFFFSNTIDGLKSWDGSNIVVVSTSIKCAVLVNSNGRLWCVGNPSNSRTIYASAFGDGTNWTLNPAPADTDPAQFVVGGQNDEVLTGLYPFRGSLAWFKNRSFGLVLGFDRSDFQVRTYSTQVGTNYQDSIQDCAGVLRWMGPLKTVWEFDGANLTKISSQINNLMNTISQGDAGTAQFTFTTQQDFLGGTLYNTDANVLPGSVLLSTTNVIVTNNSFESGSGGPCGTGEISTGWIFAGPTVCWDTSLPHDGSRDISFNSPTTFTDFHLNVLNAAGAVLQSFPNDIGSVVANQYNQISHDLSAYNGTSIKIQISGTSPSGTYTLTSKTAFSWTGGSLIYWVNAVGSNQNIFIDTLEGPGTWVSKPVFLNGISSFGYFFATDNTPSAGAVTYALYTNTSNSQTIVNGVPVAGTYVSSQTITPNAIPTISTAAYAFIGFSFSTATASAAIMVNDVTLNYNTGNKLTVPSGFPNQRYWLGVAIGSASNNRVLVYDRNRQWQLYTIPMDAMGIYAGQYYFGNSIGFFQAEPLNVYMDNGASITSFWISPQYNPDGFDNYTSLNELWLTTDNSPSSLTATYRTDGQSTDNSLGSIVMNKNAGTQNRRFVFSQTIPLTLPQQARSVQFKFSVTGSSFWRLINGNLYHTVDTSRNGG